MQQIALFLEQFKSIGLDTILLKEAVIDAVHLHIGIKLEKIQVEVKQNNVYIMLPPSGKSELFMKRNAIAAHIVNSLGRKTTPKLM